MTWRDFLAQLGRASSVTLVGPLHDSPFNTVEPTVFVDGGAHFRDKTEKFPCISVGDGDSGDAPLNVRLPAEKDFSDLAFVLNELPRHVTNLSLHGFLGGRLDHELANFGELHQFLLDRPPGARLNMKKAGRNHVVGFTGAVRLEVHGLFSVLVLESTEVKISGECKYKLNGEEPLLPVSSHGVSNVGSGMVNVSSRGPCFVFISL